MSTDKWLSGLTEVIMAQRKAIAIVREMQTIKGSDIPANAKAVLLAELQREMDLLLSQMELPGIVPVPVSVAKGAK